MLLDELAKPETKTRHQSAGNFIHGNQIDPALGLFVRADVGNCGRRCDRADRRPAVPGAQVFVHLRGRLGEDTELGERMQAAQDGVFLRGQSFAHVLTIEIGRTVTLRRAS